MSAACCISHRTLLFAGADMYVLWKWCHIIYNVSHSSCNLSVRCEHCKSGYIYTTFLVAPCYPAIPQLLDLLQLFQKAIDTVMLRREQPQNRSGIQELTFVQFTRLQGFSWSRLTYSFAVSCLLAEQSSFWLVPVSATGWLLASFGCSWLGQPRQFWSVPGELSSRRLAQACSHGYSEEQQLSRNVQALLQASACGIFAHILVAKASHVATCAE